MALGQPISSETNMLQCQCRENSVKAQKVMRAAANSASHTSALAPALGSVEHQYRRLAARLPYQAHMMAVFEALKVPGA